ncbi:Laccase domain protein YlmD [Lentibacillus sp. JNUCC-1]|uniref:peptidoglycan editing factor PgeF n=1 Tax=Lentibacillus sp. JNUCC-1 TaxID=2654513 RepID=UPI0012E8295D|nr:peptidoglycan editing factor PgeF [Lentibacillus sp. JNUCC-1]MUV36210.1 Laccase domain protein YlmD [Lentibacillus sp. JNUCC-1]
MTDCFEHHSGHLLRITKWQEIDTSLKAGFTSRQNGFGHPPYDTFNLGLHVGDEDDRVLKNRRLLGEELGFSLDRWVVGEQVHDSLIKTVTADDKGKGAAELQTALQGVDGLITDVSGIMLAAFYADCVPLYFFDPVDHRIGIAHAGWKGTVQEIAGRMITRFVKNGSVLRNIKVTIGPSISRQAYEVDETVLKQIPSKWHETTVQKTKKGHGLLDLKQLNVEILLKYGVLRHNIDVTEYCTFRDDQLFFSHRRAEGPTGRMLGYIGYSV